MASVSFNPQSDALRYIAELLGLNLNPLIPRIASGGLNPTSTLGPAFAGTNILNTAVVNPTAAWLADQAFGNSGIPLDSSLLGGVEMVGPSTPLSPREAQILFPSGNIPASFQNNGSLLGGALGLYGVSGGVQNVLNSDLPAPYRAFQGIQSGLGLVNAFNQLRGPVTNLASSISGPVTNLASYIGSLFPGGGAAAAPSVAPAVASTATSGIGGALPSLAEALPSLATAGLSLGAGIGGTKAAEAAFGRSTEQSLGSGAGAGAGALAGSIILPGIGTVLGALLGGFGGGGLGSLFHSVPTTGTRFRDALGQILDSAGASGIDTSQYNISEEELAGLSDEAKAGATALGAYLGSFAPKFKNGPTAFAYQAAAILMNNIGEQSFDFARQTFQKYGLTSPYLVFADVMNRAPNLDPGGAENIWRSTNLVFGTDPGTFDPQRIMAQAQAEQATIAQQSQATAAQQVQDQLRRIIQTGRLGVPG